jgi:transcriptional regulator with XRE-family HTH domain
VRKKSDKTFQNVRQRIARNVARFRMDQGLTFEALANRSGLHWRHVQKIEAGDSNITILTLSRLADGLLVDVADLLVKNSGQ